MRNTLRTSTNLGVLLCAFTVHAQFDALPDSNATWTTSFWIGPGYPYEGFYHTYDPVHPDTVIDGVAYQRLLQNGYYAGGLLDNGLGQVYHVQPGVSEPELLYDFDVLPGDTISNVLGMFQQEVVVVTVDTITVNGVPLKRVGVECSGMPMGIVRWTQWIGGEGGLFTTNACGSVSGTGELVCMSVNGIGYHGMVGQAVDCSMYMGMEEIGEEVMSIYPNPVTDELFVNGVGRAVRVELIMEDGRAMPPTWAVNGRMDVSDLVPGLYVLRTRAEDGAVRSTRFMKR